MYAALGKYCFQHRRIVLVGWILLFVVGVAAGGLVFGNLKDSNGGSSAESVQGSTSSTRPAPWGRTSSRWSTVHPSMPRRPEPPSVS